MKLAGAQLWEAVAYIVSLTPGTGQFAIGRALLLAETERWPRLLRHWQRAYQRGPEYETCTAIEQILRGMAAAA